MTLISHQPTNQKTMIEFIQRTNHVSEDNNKNHQAENIKQRSKWLKRCRIPHINYQK